MLRPFGSPSPWKAVRKTTIFPGTTGHDGRRCAFTARARFSVEFDRQFEDPSVLAPSNTCCTAKTARNLEGRTSYPHWNQIASQPQI